MPITLLLVWVWFQFSTKKSSASWWNCLFRRGIGGTEDRRCKHDIFWLLWSDFWHSELDGNNPCEVQFSYPEAPTNDTLTWKCAEYTHPFTLMHFQFHLQLKGTGRTFVLRTTQSMEESHTTQVYTNTCCIYTRFVYTAWYTFDKYIYIFIVNMVYIQPDFAFCNPLLACCYQLSAIFYRYQAILTCGFPWHGCMERMDGWCSTPWFGFRGSALQQTIAELIHGSASLLSQGLQLSPQAVMMTQILCQFPRKMVPPRMDGLHSKYICDSQCSTWNAIAFERGKFTIPSRDKWSTQPTF